MDESTGTRVWTIHSIYRVLLVVSVIPGLITLVGPVFPVWLRWNEIRTAQRKPSAPGVIVLLLAVLAAGVLYQLQLPLWAAVLWVLPIVATGLSLLIFGVSVARQLALPLFLLYFLIFPLTSGHIPVLSSFVLKMQAVSAASACAVLRLMAVDAYCTGSHVSAPNANVLVWTSGLTHIAVMLSLALLLTCFRKGSAWAKALFVALTVPLGLAVHTLGIVLITAAGEFSGEGSMHTMTSIVLNPILLNITALVFLLILARIMRLRGDKPSGLSAQEQPDDAAL